MTTKFTVYLCLLLIYGTIGLVRFNQRKLPKPYLLLAPFMLLVFVSEVAAHNFGLTYRNNAPPYHVLSWLHISLLGYIYYHSFSSSKKKLIVFWAVAIASGFSVIASFFIHGFWEFPKLNLVTLTLIAVSFSLFHFKEMLQAPGKLSLYREPMFWINTAHLVFFGLSFFVWQVAGIGGERWVALLIYLVNLFMYTAYFIALLNNRFTTTNE